MAIRREIYVTQKRLDVCIDVTYGSDLIPIVLKVADYTIPSGAAATAYSIGKKDNLRKQICSISDNEISFTPQKGFFDEGTNVMQIRVTYDDKDLISFEIFARCQKSIVKDDVEEAEHNPTLVQQLLSEVGVLSARLNALLSLPEGSTTGDAELCDIRVGIDGKIYETAGEAVRKEETLLKEQTQRLLRRTQINLLSEGNYKITQGKWHVNTGYEVENPYYGTLSVNVYSLSRVYLSYYHNTVTLWNNGSFVSAVLSSGEAGYDAFIDIPNNVDEMRVTMHNDYLNYLVEKQVMVVETDTVPSEYIPPIDNFVEYMSRMKADINEEIHKYVPLDFSVPFTLGGFNTNINISEDGNRIEVPTSGNALEGITIRFPSLGALLHNEFIFCVDTEMPEALLIDLQVYIDFSSGLIDIRNTDLCEKQLESGKILIRIPKEYFIQLDALDKEGMIHLTTNTATTLTFLDVRIYCDLETDNVLQYLMKSKEDVEVLKEDVEVLKEDVEVLKEDVEVLKEDLIIHPYHGKKILFMGDSITSLNVDERGWCKYFNEIIKPSLFVNTAVASARWSDYSDTVYDGNPVFNGEDNNHNNTMGNQIEKLLRGKDSTNPNYSYVAEYDDFDIILIALGTNDGVGGDIEPSFTVDGAIVPLEQLDKTIFASAFRYAIEKLQSLYPDAKIFICTPIQGWINTRSYSSTKEKGDYLKLLAGRMSIEVIDTFECGICGLYEVKNGNGRDLIDGLHPNINGAKKIGKYNAKKVIEKYID